MKPMVMLRNARPPATALAVGFAEVPVVPSPSSPERFWPQQNAVPLPSSAQLWSPMPVDSA